MILCINQWLPQGATPRTPTGTLGHLSRLSDICCLRVLGKLWLLFTRIAPQGAGVGVLSYKNDVGARCTFEAFKSVDWYHLGC